MAAKTYRGLLRETRALAREVRQGTDKHKKMAGWLNDEATDTGRISEQISAMHVDRATVGETREVARIMRGLSTTALSYATAADEALRTAAAAEQATITHHDGIQQAHDRSPAAMADRDWYRQE